MPHQLKRSYSTGSLPRKKSKPSPAAVKKKDKAFQEFWEIDRITDRRIFHGRVEYRIRWKGCSAQQDTWEPASNLVTKQTKADAKQFETGAPSAYCRQQQKDRLIACIEALGARGNHSLNSRKVRVCWKKKDSKDARAFAWVSYSDLNLKAREEARQFARDDATKQKIAVENSNEKASTTPVREESKKLNTNNTASTKKKSTSKKKDLPSSESYEVEDILDWRRKGNSKEYLIRWKGWSSKYDSWEPESNLDQESIQLGMKLIADAMMSNSNRGKSHSSSSSRVKSVRSSIQAGPKDAPLRSSTDRSKRLIRRSSTENSGLVSDRSKRASRRSSLEVTSERSNHESSEKAEPNELVQTSALDNTALAQAVDPQDIDSTPVDRTNKPLTKSIPAADVEVPATTDEKVTETTHADAADEPQKGDTITPKVFETTVSGHAGDSQGMNSTPVSVAKEANEPAHGNAEAPLRSPMTVTVSADLETSDESKQHEHELSDEMKEMAWLTEQSKAENGGMICWEDVADKASERLSMIIRSKETLPGYKENPLSHVLPLSQKDIFIAFCSDIQDSLDKKEIPDVVKQWRPSSLANQKSRVDKRVVQSIDPDMEFTHDVEPVREMENGEVMNLKQYHKIGERVYVLLKENVAAEKWAEAFVTGFRILGMGYGEIRCYSVLLSGTNERMEGVKEISVRNAEEHEYLQGALPVLDMKGVAHYTDPSFPDEYIQLRGWFVADNKKYCTACDAMRAHDEALVKNKGQATQRGDLNYPDMWDFSATGGTPVRKISSSPESVRNPATDSLNSVVGPDWDVETLITLFEEGKLGFSVKPKFCQQTSREYAVVTKVQPNSQGDKAGIQVGDVLCRVASTCSKKVWMTVADLIQMSNGERPISFRVARDPATLVYGLTSDALKEVTPVDADTAVDVDRIGATVLKSSEGTGLGTEPNEANHGIASDNRVHVAEEAVEHQEMNGAIVTEKTTTEMIHQASDASSVDSEGKIPPLTIDLSQQGIDVKSFGVGRKLVLRLNRSTYATVRLEKVEEIV